ncbi:MAG: quinone-dependent dihydroorotate dehydrogenase [Chthoniobacterales bacterium]|jgi:dihydroorotate dehydrogenase
MSLYTAIAQPLLFGLPAESAHDISMRCLAAAARLFGRYVAAPSGRPVDCLGLRFPNAIGLAAGMDKNAVALPAWPLLGFGHIEIGSVTALAQPGNPQPRIFRLPRQRALINRLGFNNQGAEAIAARLLQWKASGNWPRVPVGINLGKSRVTPLSEAAADYARSFRLLREHGDYFVVNVSSPNTPGLRDLQQTAQLRVILRALSAENRAGKPVVVKISPDLAEEDLADIVACGEEEGVAGWIATNTTIDHSSVPPELNQEGGLSGGLLRERACAVARQMAAVASRPLIGVGGIGDAASARDRLAAGAVLLQIYTALVYEGPGLPRRLARALTETPTFQPRANS